MTQASIDFLEQNRDCHLEVVRAETATKANKIKGDLYRILKTEFLPGYVFRDDCGSCLFDMVKIVYRMFDDWKARQPQVNAEIPPIVFDDTKSPSEEIQVKASFPSNKPEDAEVVTHVLSEVKQGMSPSKMKKHFRK